MAGGRENLIPFKKGQSGNPKGKKKGTVHSRTRLRRLLELSEKMKNPVTGENEEFTVLEQMDMAQIARARKGDIKAYTAILDRLEGKPNQAIKYEGTVENNNRYEGFSSEELERARQALLKDVSQNRKSDNG